MIRDVLDHSECMFHRDLTVRVYAPFSDTGYATLAQQLGRHLAVVGLADHAVLVTDETITASDVARLASRFVGVADSQSVHKAAGADGQGVGQAAGVGERAADADD